MLAAATTSLFGGKSSSLSAYTIHSTPTSTPNTSTTNLPSTSSSSRRAPFQVGLWKVLSATHKTTGKDVSVWLFEKKIIEGIRSAQLKEVVLDTLKREVRRSITASDTITEADLYILGPIFVPLAASGLATDIRAARGIKIRTDIRHRSRHRQPVFHC
jgi:hypothetical protein